MKRTEKIDYYRELEECKEDLYQLMKEVVGATDLGEIDEEDYTKTIYLDFGGRTLTYDPYYQKLFYDESGNCEDEIEDLETVKKLIKELEKRFDEFENKIKDKRERTVKEIFDKPIEGVFE